MDDSAVDQDGSIMSQSHQIVLRAQGFPQGELRALELKGREQISQPYEIELTLCSDSPSIDYEAVVGRAATLQLGSSAEGTGEGRTIHGVIAELELGDRLTDGHYGLRALLVPRLKMLDLGRQSRVFQHLSVPDMVLAVLRSELRSLLEEADVELRLSQDHPPREYVVQYQESSLSFISRLLEDEGISYHFEQGVERERLVLCDHSPTAPRAGELTFAAEGQAGEIRSLRLTRRVLPGRVLLSDYNERAPHVPLQAEAEIDGGGFGLLSEHSAGFMEPKLGQQVAQRRAEEVRCQGVILRGSTEAVRLFAGGCFQLRGHFREDLNRELLITGLHHRLRNGHYQAELEAIFAATPFRPPRTTPRPRMGGVMNAVVDASGPGEAAAVDEQGRYRVVMPFDQSGAGEGGASRPIRMAQPYGGPQQGMHFPLPPGAEVVWTGLDGDPDRPIITGTVPNANAPSVVTKDNAASAVICTSSGARMELRDGLAWQPPARSTEPEQLHATNPTFVETAGEETDTRTDKGDRDTWFKIHVPHTVDAVSYYRYGEEPNKADEDPLTDTDRADHLKSVLQLNKRGSSYDDDSSTNTDWCTSGVFDYTDRNRTIFTGGNKEDIVDGEYREEVQGDVHRIVHGKHRFDITGGALGLRDASILSHLSFKPIFGLPMWRKKEVSHASALNVTFGDSETYNLLGYSYNFKVGLDISASAAFSASATLGASVNYSAGASVNVGAGISYTFSGGKSVTECSSSQSITSGTGIELSVDTGSAAMASGWKTALGLTYAGVMGLSLVGGEALGITSFALSDDDDATKDASDGVTEATGAWGYGMAPLMMAVAALVPTIRAIARSKQKASPLVPKITISPTEVQLNVQDNWLTVAADEIDMNFGNLNYVAVFPDQVIVQAGATKLALSAEKVEWW